MASPRSSSTCTPASARPTGPPPAGWSRSTRPRDGTGTPLDPDQYVADFAAALTQVVTDPALAAAMGKAGRQRAIDAFSWTAIADQTVEVYRSVL